MSHFESGGGTKSSGDRRPDSDTRPGGGGVGPVETRRVYPDVTEKCIYVVKRVSCPEVCNMDVGIQLKDHGFELKSRSRTRTCEIRFISHEITLV